MLLFVSAILLYRVHYGHGFPEAGSGVSQTLSYCVSALWQMGISKEFFLLFSVIDENQSWYLSKNIYEFGDGNTNIMDEDFQESNMMHGISGFLYSKPVPVLILALAHKELFCGRVCVEFLGGTVVGKELNIQT